VGSLAPGILLVLLIGAWLHCSQGTDKVLTQLRDAFDKNFDKFEMYVLRNIFHVPEDLQMAQVEMGDADNEEFVKEQELDKELKMLHEQLSEVCHFKI
jgi:hypothetical protein